MSRKEDILRGITNQDLKDMVRLVLGKGFVLGPMTGTTHCSVIWPPTNEKVGFGTTVSDRNYWKDFARQCETISGLTLVEKHRHGKTSKKNLMKNGYTTTYRPPSADHWTGRLDELLREYHGLALEFRIIASPGDSEPGEYVRAKEIVLRMAQIETLLKELHHPIPEVDAPRLRRVQ